jgi:hypothetical protein
MRQHAEMGDVLTGKLLHLIMVFLIKIARKITAFNKICTHHQYFSSVPVLHYLMAVLFIEI